MVADALVWHGAGPDLLHEVVSANGPDFVPYVARATSAEIRRYEDAARLLADIAPRPGS